MTKAPLTKVAMIASAFALITACATSEERAASEAETQARLKAGKGERVDKVCFAGSIDSFGDTTRRTVVVRKSRRERYLIETSGCPQLRDAQRIGLDEHGSCLRRGDKLIVSDSAFRDDSGLGPDRCYISAIYRWNDLDRQEKSAEAMDDEG